MEQIPPEVARKILSRDFGNLISRVQSGGKLSRGERSMLQSIAAGSSGNDAASAASYHELAEILGVSRQAIHAWKKMGDSPMASANGNHDVAAWREFMARKGLKGGAALAPDEESALRARKLLAEVMEREFRLSVRKGEYVPSYQLMPKMVGSLGTFDLKSWFSWVSRDLELAMGFYLDARVGGEPELAAVAEFARAHFRSIPSIAVESMLCEVLRRRNVRWRALLSPFPKRFLSHALPSHGHHGASTMSSLTALGPSRRPCFPRRPSRTGATSQQGSAKAPSPSPNACASQPWQRHPTRPRRRNACVWCGGASSP